jgi:UrcA family protein
MKTARQTRRVGTIVLAGLLALGSQAAPAEDLDGTALDADSTTIDFQDIDVSTPDGARWLYRRIVSSARAVCWLPLEHPLERRSGVQWVSTLREHARRCFDESINDALARVNDATGLDIERLAALDRYDEAGLVASRTD